MSLDSIRELEYAHANGQIVEFSKAATGSNTANTGHYRDLSRSAGAPLLLPIPPEAGIAYDSSMPQGMHYSEAGPGEINYLSRIMGIASLNGTLVVVDRLCATSGARGDITGFQPLNVPPLPRYQDEGCGVIYLAAWLTAQVGPQEVVAHYINQDGQPAVTEVINTQVTATVLMRPNMLLPMPLAEGDTAAFGVTGLEFLDVHDTAPVQGNWGVVLQKRICEVPYYAFHPFNYDWMDLGKPIIEPGAFLNMMALCSTTSAASVLGQMVIAQG